MADDQQKVSDQDILDAIHNAPTGGATAVLQPIGVPTGFVAARDAGVPYPNGTTIDQPARYFEGDDWAPASASPQDIAKVQQQLVAAGLIPQGSQYHVGIWDETTRAAYRSALTYANASGLDAQASLNVLASSKPTAVPPAHLMPDIATIAQSVKQTVQQKLGRDVTPEEMGHLSNVLLGFDNKAIAAQDAAATAGPGAAVQSVDPAAEFAQYLDTTYKPEIDRTAGVTDLSKNRERLMSNIFSLDSQMKGSA